MPRFFKEHFAERPFIDGADAHHIIKSLRMRCGEELTVCDTKGIDYRCVITECTDKVSLKILSYTANATEPSVSVTLYQCITKGDKMDTIVRQAVESGACRIVPVLSANCVSRPDPKSLEKKTERWQKIAFEAAGQCGRGILPKVGECLTLPLAANEAGELDRSFFCYELGGKSIGKIEKDVRTVGIIIGPEGGFTAAEAEQLKNAGSIVTTLGPRIFRAETAPIAALAAVMLQSGNM